jgi:uncharacterized protein (DUF1778 family)
MLRPAGRNIQQKFFLDLCASEAYNRFMLIASKGRKMKRFVARLSQEDKTLFECAAASEGESMAQFIIRHARRAAEQTLAKREKIQLDAAESRRFVEALLAPQPPATERMKRAAKLYRKTVTEI